MVLRTSLKGIIEDAMTEVQLLEMVTEAPVQEPNTDTKILCGWMADTGDEVWLLMETSEDRSRP